MKNKRIMIIGGTGALGKSLTKRWIFDNDILIFSRNEHKQEDMKREYSSGLGSTQVSLSKCLYRIPFIHCYFNNNIVGFLYANI